MPSKNAIKQFEADMAYHVYNRGVDKRIIFNDDRDYAVFLSFLKYALTKNNDEDFDGSLISEAQRFNFRRLNLADEIDLLAFCLMPNHFHLLLYQYAPDAVTRLMRSIATAYSIYFNKRYQRSGTLFQGRYKASRINNESYWQHISRYIHLNPLDLGKDYATYASSSFRAYSGDADINWINTEMVLGNFQDFEEYKKFHDDYIPFRAELLDVKNMLADH